VEVNVDDEDAALAKLDQVFGYDLSADHPCQKDWALDPPDEDWKDFSLLPFQKG
jgi:hypothetical protein